LSNKKRVCPVTCSEQIFALIGCCIATTSLVATAATPAQAASPTVEELLIKLEERDAVIKDLARRVDDLEHRAASPPAALIEGMDRLGFDLTHVYGLTEVYGPATVCAKQPGWAKLDVGERAMLNGRQGVRYTLEEGVAVLDPQTMQPRPISYAKRETRTITYYMNPEFPDDQPLRDMARQTGARRACPAFVGDTDLCQRCGDARRWHRATEGTGA